MARAVDDELPVGADPIGDAAQDYFTDRAFWATGIMEEDILLEAQAVLLDAVGKGTPYDTVVAQLDEVLRGFLPERDAAGRIVNIPHRLETIARTNITDAVNQGRLAALADPDVDGFVTGLLYSAILDDRVRENHAAWDGVIKPQDFWSRTKRVPPNGYNCRCTVVAVTLGDDAEETPDDELPNTVGLDIPDGGFKDDVPAALRTVVRRLTGRRR